MKKNKTIPWSDRITNIQGHVLERLAKYKFLTIGQMLELEVGTSQYKYLWKQMASLRDRKKGLVDRRSFNLEARLGRVEDFYFLTKHGKEVLVFDFHLPEEEIRMPIGNTIAYKDYHHRRSTIDFQIILSKWAKGRGVQVPFFHTYFDKKGNNRSSKNLSTLTKVELEAGDYIIPDAAFQLKVEGRERLYLFEMHNGSDTLRLLKQLHKHALALVKRFTHKAFGYSREKSYTTLLLFEHNSTKEAFIRRLQKSGDAFKEVQQFFLCKSLDDLRKTDFSKGWSTIFGQEKGLII